MTVLILYDSRYGNTQKIAEAVAQAVNGKAVKVTDFEEAMLDEISLLIAGSPTYGGKPTPELLSFLEKIPPNALDNIKVAAFDTRFLAKDQNFALQLLMKAIGYAAPKIADNLESKGGKLVAPPEGFIVKAKEGPLKDGELERAKTWAKEIINSNL